jgi:phosphoglycolate phosphatase
MPRKPAPDMIHKAMRDLGMDGAIYVGDSEVDLQVAENAKQPCLLVTWGFRDKEDLEAAGGKHFCHEPEDLPQIIEEMIHLYYAC